MSTDPLSLPGRDFTNTRGPCFAQKGGDGASAGGGGGLAPGRPQAGPTECGNKVQREVRTLASLDTAA